MGIRHHCNPRDLVEPWAQGVVMTWAQCRGEFGLLHLPDPGGINGQSAWLMDAFAACAAAESELLKEERDRAGDR